MENLLCCALGKKRVPTLNKLTINRGEEKSRDLEEK